MKIFTRVSIAVLLGAVSAWCQPGRVLVLEDFEPPAAGMRWSPALAYAAGPATHGARSARLTFEPGVVEASATGFPADWRAFDRLLFDIHATHEGIRTLTLRLHDRDGADRSDYFEARSKIILLKGWNHVEVRLANLQASSWDRAIDLGSIRRITLAAERVPLPWTLHVDNFRLAAGAEPASSASRTEPQNTVTVIRNRFFEVRQVARPEEVPESDEVRRLRAAALAELERFNAALRAARLQGIDTIYAERFLVAADLGLYVRPRLPWFNNDGQKKVLFTAVAEGLVQGRRELDDEIDGVVRRPHSDDTQALPPLVPPYPAALKGSPAKGWFYRDPDGRPMAVISLHSSSRVLERFFASPNQHIESYTVGGGSRWNIEQSPVWEAFHKHDDAKRVGWDGWCGHLIRDIHSMGGSRIDNTVICLESPHIREAIDQYIRINIPRLHENPQLLYDIMAYELMYICYCDRSQRMFRGWLAKKHGTVEQANSIYGTAYKSFEEITAPPVKNSRPLAGTNRALWYDWARFNQDRFTDHLLWVRSRIRQLSPHVPLAAGGSSSMLAGRTGTTGIDEERIVNEAGDLIIHEGAGSTMGMDLQLALSETPKPLADPEMSLRSVYDLLPHLLHGKSVMQFFHWPAQPQNEYFSMNGSSLAHSWRHSIQDIAELIRATLDARRLAPEVEAFVETPAEVAILYSQTATLQLPPEMLTWSTTPYLAELRKAYDAGLYLDAKVTFVTERQIRKGRLARYKLLIVPAVRNLPADVVEDLWRYAEAGGRILVLPESLLADEYNRPRDYLARLGIAIQRTLRPSAAGRGAMVQGYDQSFSEEMTITGAARATLEPAAAGQAAIESHGVRQEIRASDGAVEFRYAGGGPAIVRVPMGRGAVWYSGATLESRGYARLLDRLFGEAGVHRPVRVRAETPDRWRIEARLAAGPRKLLYVVNHENAPVRLRLEAPEGWYTEIHDLRARRETTELAVPARQTAIYEFR